MLYIELFWVDHYFCAYSTESFSAQCYTMRRHRFVQRFDGLVSTVYTLFCTTVLYTWSWWWCVGFLEVVLAVNYFQCTFFTLIPAAVYPYTNLSNNALSLTLFSSVFTFGHRFVISLWKVSKVSMYSVITFILEIIMFTFKLNITLYRSIFMIFLFFMLIWCIVPRQFLTSRVEVGMSI